MRSVDDMRTILAPFGLSVQESPGSTSTAPLAAAALGCEVGAIVKSLLFFADDTPLLALIAGDRRADRARLAEERGAARVRLAKPDEVIAITGYAVGGVPPIGHPSPIPTLLDRHLLRHHMVYAAAGGPNALFAVHPQTLLQMTGAQITEASEPMS